MATIVRQSGIYSVLTQASSIIPVDRLAFINWQNAGLQSKGGPSGAGILAVSAGRTISNPGGLSPRGVGLDDTSNIQNAINAASANQIVLLNSGTFILNQDNGTNSPLILPTSGVTLRGSGAGVTILQRGSIFTATISNGSGGAGTILNVTSIVGALVVGTVVIGDGVTAGTMISSLGTGTGGTGTYNVNNSQLVASETMTAGGATLPRTTTVVPSTTGIFVPDANSVNGITCPIIVIGPGRFSNVDNRDLGSYEPSSTSNLITDGMRGSFSITVADASPFTVGHFVLLDELAVQSYAPTPRGFLDNNTNGTEGTVLVLAGDRIVSNRHTPAQTFQDDPPDSCGWFSRPDPVNVATGSYTDGRFTSEIKEISAINGNTIVFTSPLMITYRTSHTAQLTRYSVTVGTGNSVHITNAGIENLTVYLSGNGGIFFNCCAYSWAKNVEVDTCFGIGIAISGSFRCEVRDSYVHTSPWPVPAADSYAICLEWGASECLIENNISRDYCKVIAMRASGQGSVVAYNYMDDGWDYSGDPAASPTFQECGINASHMSGGHHVLFEGNYCFNADSDYTHGNSIYLTFFRNQLTGQRKNFTDTAARCGGGAAFSYWLTYVGNVLGVSGGMAGWGYTDSRMGCDGSGNSCIGFPSSGWDNSGGWDNKDVWKIGYDPERFPMNPDLVTLNQVIRDGNYDFLTNSQRWHNTPATFAMPNSLYLPGRPAFFNTYSNTWPPYDPSNGTVHSNAAKFRYDNGTPNAP